MEEYGVKWQEWNKNDQLVMKEKFFKCANARTKYCQRLEEKDNFNNYVAWVNPIMYEGERRG